jgi:hypothetical protein
MIVMNKKKALSENIIVKETSRGNGIYIIDVDQKKARTVEGNSYREQVTNAIQEFLSRPEANSSISNSR